MCTGSQPTEHLVCRLQLQILHALSAVQIFIYAGFRSCPEHLRSFKQELVQSQGLGGEQQLPLVAVDRLGRQHVSSDLLTACLLGSIGQVA